MVAPTGDSTCVLMAAHVLDRCWWLHVCVVAARVLVAAHVLTACVDTTVTVRQLLVVARVWMWMVTRDVDGCTCVVGGCTCADCVC